MWKNYSYKGGGGVHAAVLCFLSVSWSCWHLFSSSDPWIVCIILHYRCSVSVGTELTGYFGTPWLLRATSCAKMPGFSWL